MPRVHFDEDIGHTVHTAANRMSMTEQGGQHRHRACAFRNSQARELAHPAAGHASPVNDAIVRPLREQAVRTIQTQGQRAQRRLASRGQKGDFATQLLIGQGGGSLIVYAVPAPRVASSDETAGRLEMCG